MMKKDYILGSVPSWHMHEVLALPIAALMVVCQMDVLLGLRVFPAFVQALQEAGQATGWPVTTALVFHDWILWTLPSVALALTIWAVALVTREPREIARKRIHKVAVCFMAANVLPMAMLVVTLDLQLRSALGGAG